MTNFHSACLILVLSIISINISLMYGKLCTLIDEITLIRSEYEKIRKFYKKQN